MRSRSFRCRVAICASLWAICPLAHTQLLTNPGPKAWWITAGCSSSAVRLAHACPHAYAPPTRPTWRTSARRSELSPGQALIRGSSTVRHDRYAWRRTAQEDSNAGDRERLRQATVRPASCPNDPERPRRREFASRGSGVKSPPLQVNPQVSALTCGHVGLPGPVLPRFWERRCPILGADLEVSRSVRTRSCLTEHGRRALGVPNPALAARAGYSPYRELVGQDCRGRVVLVVAYASGGEVGKGRLAKGPTRRERRTLVTRSW